MAKLSKKEQAILDRLSAKAEAPDEPITGKSFSISVDLGDEKQVAMATKLGLGSLFDDDDDDTEEVEDGSDAEDDDQPKRRSYFND